MRIRDPGWRKVGSGIRDKHPGSATLLIKIFFFVWYILYTFHSLALCKASRFNVHVKHKNAVAVRFK